MACVGWAAHHMSARPPAARPPTRPPPHAPGPSGACVREVCRVSGCDIKSWTADPDARCPRASRVFRVEGPRVGVARAVAVM